MDQTIKLPDSAQTARPWRIHELTSDFRLEDVWRLPTPGGPEDFPRLVELIAGGDSAESPSRLSRLLWATRWKLGELFGWDDAEAGVGSRVETLRDRLPADLRAGPRGPEFETLPFSPVYLTDDEFAAEIANRTVHGVMHLGWVPAEDGGFTAQMAVYVKPNGRFGDAYMAAIRPFRYLIVYPSMMQLLERRWKERGNDGAPRPTPAGP